MRKAILLVLAFAAAACGGSSTTSSSSPSAPQPASPATVAVANDARLGQILVDGSGKTLYLFEADKTSSSTCYGQCAAYWPPLLTNGAPIAGAGVKASLLGTTPRTDGTLEVTYGGHPLYYVVTDHNPGDTTGQGVANFGAPWEAVGPDGKQVG